MSRYELQNPNGRRPLLQGVSTELVSIEAPEIQVNISARVNRAIER